MNQRQDSVGISKSRVQKTDRCYSVNKGREYGRKEIGLIVCSLYHSEPIDRKVNDTVLAGFSVEETLVVAFKGLFGQ